jgi:hypothetical protein
VEHLASNDNVGWRKYQSKSKNLTTLVIPMSTAQGNMADIVCDYGDFGLTVEVTMQSGQRQYETEGEPVTRHLAKYKTRNRKNLPTVYLLHQT